MNIVYGGSFNPPTKAHLEIVNKLLDRFSNSKVIILPVGNKYHKKSLIDFSYRYDMLKLQFKNNNRVIISQLENTNEFLGTYDSLSQLGNTYNNLYLVIGSDNLHNFNKWINYEGILRNYSLLIFKRNNDDVNKLMEQFSNLNPNYEVIEFNNNISASLIRQDVKNNKELISSDVYEYILKNNLYEVK